MKIMKFVLACFVVFPLVGVRAQNFPIDTGITNFVSVDYSLGTTNLQIGLTVDGNVVQVNSNATFTVGNIYTGESSASNRLEAVDGATIDAATVIVGVYAGASNNLITVSNGTLNAAGGLFVGLADGSNRVDVTDGGILTSEDAWVGYGLTSESNSILVSEGFWTNSGALTIGTNGNSGNFVTVTNGGIIELESLEIVGDGNGFNLDAGGLLSVTSNFNASVTNFYFNEGASLYVGGVLSGQTNGIEGARTLGISGSWGDAATNITVGGSSSSNALMVLDGGLVNANLLMVGGGSNSLDNTVSVSGAGSELMVGFVQVGATNSSGNSVELISGGKMTISSDIQIFGSNNTFVVHDGGHLNVETNFNASFNGFEFGNGGILETTGALSGMSNTVDGARSVRLTGTNAVWALGSTNLNVDGATVYLSEGAQLTSSNALLVSSAEVKVDGSGSAWANAGTLIVGGSNDNALWIKNGGVVSNTDAFIGGYGNDNLVDVSGSNSAWNVSGELMVGDATSGNTLHISDGAFVSSTSAIIGANAGNSGNRVLIEGMGSVWSNVNDLAVGAAGAGNRLELADGGAVYVGQTLAVKNGSAMSFSSGGHASVSNYFQDATSVLQFDSVTNVAVDPGLALIDATGDAEFEADASLAFTGMIGELEVGVTNSRKLVSSANLIVGGVTNATGADLDVLHGTDSSSLLDYGFHSENDNLYMQVFRQSLAESAGFVPGSQMFAVSAEVDQMASDGGLVANTQLTMLGQMSGAQQNAQLSQLYDRGAATYQHMNSLYEAMAQVHKSSVMPDAMWPVGAGGPHLYGEQARGWMKGYGSWASQDADVDFSGFDQTVYGVAVGFDQAFGDLLAGLAGGYASSDIDQNDGDNSKSGTGYGLVYGSWGTSDWFADTSLALGFGSVENKSGTAFDTSSEADTKQLAFSLGGGKEMVFRNDTIFLTPSAAMLGGWYAQDGYTERSTTAVGRKVDDYDRWSFRSAVGIQAAFEKELAKRVLMPEVHVNWLHEFNVDEDQVGYSLADGTGSYSFGMQAPVADILEAGFGVSLWTESQSGVVYEWALGFDSRFGDGYSATAFNARLVAEF